MSPANNIIIIIAHMIISLRERGREPQCWLAVWLAVEIARKIGVFAGNIGGG